MEAMIYEDSPLASYLEGEGAASDHEIHVIPQPHLLHDHISEEEEEEVGERQHYDSDGGGKHNHDDHDDHDDGDDDGAGNRINFAPSGHININDKIKSKMLKPVHLKPFVQYPSLAVILEACKSSLTVNLGEEDNKRFLEQIGYKIVASQLLNEQSPPTYATASSILAANASSLSSATDNNNSTTTNSNTDATATTSTTPGTKHHDISESRAAMLSVRGAILAPATSFFLVWLLHWAVPPSQQQTTNSTSSLSLPSSPSSSSQPLASSSSSSSSSSQSALPSTLARISIALLLFAGITYELYSLSRRHWLRHLRRYVIEVTGGLVGNSQALDSAASAALAVIQEVELVSRGYRLSHPLPPVSRIEESSPTKHCLRLRRVLSRSLVQLLERYLEAKQKLTPLSNQQDLEKYYEIYDFSVEELHEAESVLAAAAEEKVGGYGGYGGEGEGDDGDGEAGRERTNSLRSLQVVFKKLYAARKGLLCCLLAIPAHGREEDIPVWGVAADELQALTERTSECLVDLAGILNEQNGDWPMTSQLATSPIPVDSTRTRNRAQLRKLNSLSQGIRGLHAKMNLIREESESCLDGGGGGGGSNEPDTDFTTTLLTMYDSIGTDLRSLIQEWEAGRHALQIAFGPSSSGCSSPIAAAAAAAIAPMSTSSTTSAINNASDYSLYRRSSTSASVSSRPPSGKWACLPGSPAPSTLSGTTAIDTSMNGFLISANHSSSNSIDQQVMLGHGDGPENALRILTGNEEEGGQVGGAVAAAAAQAAAQFKSPDMYLDDDEEVFEAIAAPVMSRKRSSLRASMSREERMAKMKEERARQSAARERMDTNTSMLRELETVIKLKPKGGTTGGGGGNGNGTSTARHRKGRTSI